MANSGKRVSSLLVCLCSVALSLFVLSGVVECGYSPAYGIAYQSYACPYATSVALYSGLPNNVYLSCYGTGLVRITPVGTSYSSTYQSACHGATSIAVNPYTGIVYGACALSGILSWDSTGYSYTTLATPAQCTYPSSVAVYGSTTTVYAACGLGGGVISIVGTASPTTVLTPAQCPTATSVAVDQNSGVAYAGCVGAGVLMLRSGAAPLTVAGPSICANPTSVTVHPTYDVVYAVCAPSGTQGASIITIVGDQVQSYPLAASGCNDPRGVSVDAYGDQIYVACGSSGGVVALDPVSSTILNVVPASVCHIATGVAAPSSTFSYVLATCSNPYVDTAGGGSFSYNYPPSVVAIAVKTATYANSLTCSNAWDITVDYYQNIAYVSCGSGQGILAVAGNTDTTNIIANASVCNDALSLAVNINTYTLYASCNSLGGIVALTNPNPYSTVGPLPYTVTNFISTSACYYAYSMTVDNLNAELYAGCYNVIGANVYSAAITYPAGSGCSYASAIAVNNNLSPPRVYSICGSTSVYNGSSVLLNNAAICSYPNDLAVYPTTGVLYVACYSSSTILAILPNGTITTASTYAQCAYPYQLSVNPYTGVLYAACYESGIISITTTFSGTSPVFTVANLLPLAYCQYPRDVAVNPYGSIVYALCSGTTGQVSPTVISIYLY